jgi:cobalamin synthase
MNRPVPQPWDVQALRRPSRPRLTQPPPQFDADYAGEQSRAALFVRIVGVVPHWIVLIALYYAVALTTLVAWFAILFTGAIPRGLFAFGALYLRWQARFLAYACLLSDQYPPFGDAPYPAQFVIQYPERSSRLTTLLRAFLAIPAGIVLWLLAYVALAAVVIAWFAILFTRRYPLGLYLFVIGFLRWSLRLGAYLLLLTDHYPPFQLSETADPAAPLLRAIDPAQTALQ